MRNMLKGIEQERTKATKKSRGVSNAIKLKLFCFERFYWGGQGGLHCVGDGSSVLRSERAGYHAGPSSNGGPDFRGGDEFAVHYDSEALADVISGHIGERRGGNRRHL